MTPLLFAGCPIPFVANTGEHISRATVTCVGDLYSTQPFCDLNQNHSIDLCPRPFPLQIVTSDNLTLANSDTNKSIPSTSFAIT